jgi:2-polyprenyl-3-methyl-5-hydroxy-6-metoxy-1,4-benzoquinol methylase
VLRYYLKEKSKNDVKILEVGGGAGNNLWALELDGFSVYGIDGSSTALEF